MPIQIFVHDLTQDEVHDIRNAMAHHPPTGEKGDRHQIMRGAAIDMAVEIFSHVPAGRERSLAITKLQEALMWANAGIACNPEITE